MEWQAKIIKYQHESRIAVYFEKRQELIQRIKKLPDARWSYKLGAWHLPDTEENRKRFKLEDKVLRSDKLESIEKFRQWLRSRRYSESTVSSPVFRATQKYNFSKLHIF